ncbi:hypothetical protein CJ255_09500, partial [Candidatus Viridilinea mediisalina]
MNETKIKKDENTPHLASETYSIVSMFSGCGGMDLGFRGDFTFLGKHYARLPFAIVWANEINVAA